MREKKPTLTIQDEQYAQLLFQGVSQYDAFLEIRPHAATWKRNSIDSNASKLATKIEPRLEQLRSKMEKKFEISQERVLREYHSMAFVDPREVFEWGPGGVTLKESSSLSEDAARAVAEASETMAKSGGTIRVKLHSKTEALKGIRDMLGYDAPKRTEEIKKSLSLELQAELKSLTLEELRELLRETRIEGDT